MDAEQEATDGEEISALVSETMAEADDAPPEPPELPAREHRYCVVMPDRALFMTGARLETDEAGFRAMLYAADGSLQSVFNLESVRYIMRRPDGLTDEQWMQASAPVEFEKARMKAIRNQMGRNN